MCASIENGEYNKNRDETKWFALFVLQKVMSLVLSIFDPEHEKFVYLLA